MHKFIMTRLAMTKLLHTTTLLCTLFIFADAGDAVNLKFVQKTVDALAFRDSITPDDIAKLKPQLDRKPSGKLKPIQQSGKAGRRKLKEMTEWKTDDWQAAVIQDKEYFCGGALIAAQWVLTAAQCAYQKNQFEVVLGVQSPCVFTAGRASFQTTTKIVHTDYNPATLYSDIALIKLPVEIALLPSDHINTIRLPKKADATKSLETSVAEASGWRSGSLETPSFYSLSMTVIASSECAAVFGKSSITSSHLCAQTTTNLDTFCSGDIGSPLVMRDRGSNKYTQIGILSFRATDCSTNRPACFTRVSSFLGWISENTDMSIS